MKTLIFQNPEKTIRVEAKVDIFATNAQLLTAGFDTRFTHMEIVDSDAAIAEGLSLTEIENSWIAVKAFAEAVGYTLDVIDLNEEATDSILDWLAAAGTVNGTIGLQALTGLSTDFFTDLAVDDIITIDGFTYTIDSKSGGPPVLQIETATSAGQISSSGNLEMIVTGALVAGSPLTIPVAVLDSDDPSDVATKIRAALNIAAITDDYTVSGATTAIILTPKQAAANDATLNIDIQNDTTVGYTDAATSANTLAGAADSAIDIVETFEITHSGASLFIKQ